MTGQCICSVQVIDDTKGQTLASASTVMKDLKDSLESGANVVRSQAAACAGGAAKQSAHMRGRQEQY